VLSGILSTVLSPRAWSHDRWINVVSLLVGVVGIALGVYFYLASIQKPEPTYLVDPVRTQLVNTSEPGAERLGITFDKQPLDAKEITAVRVYFWNNGTAPIRKADVLGEYRIGFVEPKIEIIDARILQASRSLARFGIDKTNMEGIPARLWFDVMEPGDGVTVQIIYLGGPGLTVRMTGSAIGTREPIGVQPTAETMQRVGGPSRAMASRQNAGKAVFTLLLLAGAIVVSLSSEGRRWVRLMVALVMLIAVGFLVVDWIDLTYPAVPSAIMPSAER